MLTEQSIAIVKSIVPVLEQHGELLTRHFNQRMLEKNPEVAPSFNRANPAAGSQQEALAAALRSSTRLAPPLIVCAAHSYHSSSVDWADTLSNSAYFHETS